MTDRCENRVTRLLRTDADGTEHRQCVECGEQSVWPDGLDAEHGKFVLLGGVLAGVNFGNRFFTPNIGGDPTRLADGRVAYEVLGYADTVAEAQMKLYGRVYNGEEVP